MVPLAGKSAMNPTSCLVANLDSLNVVYNAYVRAENGRCASVRSMIEDESEK